ncbi:MAG: MFS transporter [Flavobacterium sp.]|nr:MFS transporter [Flavobacterium sp.]
MIESQNNLNREYLLLILSAATFIIFFQLYMVAPLIPTLSLFFNTSSETVGLIIPAYLIPYGISTLFYGLLADKIGMKTVTLLSLLCFCIFTACTALSQSVQQLIFWRFITAVGAGGIIPTSLAWIGQNYKYELRGRPLGWLFGAMAGGGATGSSLGVIMEPFVGWKMLFLGVSIIGAIIWVVLYFGYQKVMMPEPIKNLLTFDKVFYGYRQLFVGQRGKRAYIFVLLNGIFHSGIFTWLGLYFQKVYSLDSLEIGLAILGYGVPGFLLGPYIGKLADRKGRRKLLPLGLAISAISVFILAFDIPLYIAAISVTTLSLGYDLTQPLLAGIITQVGKERPGQAMSLNVFMLFLGFGLGSYLFGLALQVSLVDALILFSTFQLVLSALALWLFKSEKNNEAI